MNSYQASTPRTRAAISLAAAAMAALTLSLSVLPAKVNSGGNVDLANASRAAATVASTAPGDGMPIVVYGVRGKEAAMQKVRAPHVGPPMKQQI